MSDPFFDAMLTTSRQPISTPRKPPPILSSPSDSDWEFDSPVIQPTQPSSAKRKPIEDSTVALGTLTMEALYAKIVHLERQREEDRHTVLELNKKVEKQVEELATRKKDRMALQALSARVRQHDNDIAELQSSSGNKKPKRPLLNFDLHDDGLDSHSLSTPLNKPRLVHTDSRVEIKEIKAELLDWLDYELEKRISDSSVTQINWGKGGKKKVKKEIRDEVLSMIKVPTPVVRNLDVIAGGVSQYVKEALSIAMKAETTHRQKQIEALSTSIAALMSDRKKHQKVEEESRQAGKLLQRLREEEDSTKKVSAEVKSTRMDLEKAVKVARGDTKKIKGDIKNQFNWAKREIGEMTEKLTALRVNLAKNLDEAEGRVKPVSTIKADLTQLFNREQSIRAETKADVDRLLQEARSTIESFNKDIERTRPEVIEAISAQLRQDRVAKPDMADEERAVLSSASRSGSLNHDEITLYDQVRDLIDKLERQNTNPKHLEDSGSITHHGTSVTAPPPTPVTTSIGSFQGPCVPELICPVPTGIIVHSGVDMPSTPVDPPTICPVAQGLAPTRVLSDNDDDSTWTFSPVSHATTTLSDIEADLFQLRHVEADGSTEGKPEILVEQKEKEAEIEKEEKEKTVESDTSGVKAWPEEWPIFWEGGDPTGLGRNRDKRDGPAGVGAL